ncbi:MAG: GntR family transcriptional regulator [Paracoccaceae bacterium]|nr:MAG: GntR family transcriptional regulator [Paracoccaceae bacterium]
MRLRTEIVDGHLQLGDALSESMVAARYGVSRTPVREAFAFLGLEGLVRTEPQQGTYVFTITRAQFNQLSETRSILECAAFRLSIERNRKMLLRKWRRIVKSMQAAMERGDGLAYCQLDGEFHHQLFALADNPHLLEATQSFATKIATVRNRLGSNPEHMKHSFSEHENLLRLLEDDKVNSAVELLDHHIRFKGETFWAAASGQISSLADQRSQT